MFRLQVWYENHWKWGVRTYESMEAATSRLKQLSKVGIKARVKPTTELFN